MIEQFALYDVLSIFIPGAFFILLIDYGSIFPSWLQPAQNESWIGSTSAFVVVSYVAGLMLHALGRRFCKKNQFADLIVLNKKLFSINFRTHLFATLNKTFNVNISNLLDKCHKSNLHKCERKDAKTELQDVFERCYEIVRKDYDNEAYVKNTQYTMFRTLTVTFALIFEICAAFSFIFLSAYLILSDRFLRSPHVYVDGAFFCKQLFLAIGTLVCAELSYERMEQRSEDFTKTVCYEFMMLTCNSIKKEKPSSNLQRINLPP